MAKKKETFLDYERQNLAYRPIDQRVKDYKEIEVPLTPDELVQQTARCIDCGIPFCHGQGCPVSNRIPEFNELVHNGQWKEACANLHSTNNFPEITGRICPAPCEASCTLAINDKAVMIRHIEYQIVERGFAEGWILPLIPAKKTGRRVAVIGSGPAGLAAAQQLARAGHNVEVFERDEQPGGLLRYGIPDFKLEKWVIDRRLEQMKAEGVKFNTGLEVGRDISARYLDKMFDGICITMGACEPRDLPIAGRDNDGVHFAMELLWQQNKVNAGESIEPRKRISAKGKHVVVIGGGDTGSDCVGTSRRHGAASIHQLEILPQPPEERSADTPWPMWPKMMRTSSSHQEGCERMWSVMTKEFKAGKGGVKEIVACKVEWTRENGQWKPVEVKGSEFTLKADLVLLAMGFVHVEHNPFIKDLGVELDGRGNIVVDNFQTSVPNVFAAGDAVSGASLVVRAIDAGRKAAASMNAWLKS